MAPALARRTLLRASLLAGAAGIASATALPAEAASAATAATAAIASSAQPRAIAARRAVKASYGPNGTHYPAALPWLGDRAPTELVADADWADIAAKIKTLTPAQVAAGAVVRVRPGTLSAGGSGSSAPAMLANLGSTAWTRNVLICPRDGFTSVTIAAKGLRIDRCANLSLFGFSCAGGVTLTLCDGVQLGWSRFDTVGITRGGIDISLYEVVTGFRQNAEDTGGIRPTDAYAMTNIQRFGCVFGPSVKPAGSSAHCDTIQFEGTGTGAFGPVISTDCVDFGSSNAVYMLAGPTRAEFRHCLILGGQAPWQVYPLRSGDYAGTPNAFSGGCPDVRIYDSAVVGAVGSMSFTFVVNSTLSYKVQTSQQPRASGTWTVDTASANWTRAQIMAKHAVKDYELTTLRALWTW